MSTYFASDGSYGQADGIVILDTRAWNAEQWERVEFALDHERAAVAASIALENGEL